VNSLAYEHQYWRTNNTILPIPDWATHHSESLIIMNSELHIHRSLLGLKLLCNIKKFYEVRIGHKVPHAAKLKYKAVPSANILLHMKSTQALPYKVLFKNTNLPDKSVTCTNVSLKLAKMCATPKTTSPSRTCGPKDTWTCSCWTFPFLGAITDFHGNERKQNVSFNVVRPAL